jgi:tRNA(Arg) A34 adenosine deaminase TadA
MVAIMVAHQLVGGFELGGEGQPSYDLVASTEPCSMCFGALPWSGIRHLVCGARNEDAAAAGFDEGPKPAEWVRTLEDRGITVERDVLRDEAAAVLREHAEEGDELYKGRH